MAKPFVFTAKFWVDQVDAVVRSSAQGFLLGAGVAATAGDFAILSVDSLFAGVVAALSMAVLSVVTALKFGPTNDR